MSVSKYPVTDEKATDTSPLLDQSNLLSKIRNLENELIGLKRELISKGTTAPKQEISSHDHTFALFMLHNRAFAIPIWHIEQVELVPSLVELAQPQSEVIGLCNYHGDYIAVIDLSVLMGLAPNTITSSKVLVVCNLEGVRLAVLMDETHDVVVVNRDQIRVSEEVLPGAIRAVGILDISGQTATIVDMLSIALQIQLDFSQELNPQDKRETESIPE